MRLKRTLAALLALCGPVAAQDPSHGSIPLGEDADNTTAVTSATPRQPHIEEIVVTAQRRQDRLIDVPIAVTALNRDTLESRGIGRIDELNSLSPGLQISRSPANSTISQIAIRGSSQINPAIYWDPAVGLYLDGVYIGKAQGSIFDVVDLVGIEVLRGPQGTLYGRNTIAGTINLVSRRPGGEFLGRVGTTLGRFNQRVYRASLDLPRIADVAMTLGARSERRDGWVKATESSPVSELNDRASDGFHFAALAEPTDTTELLYRFDWSDIDQANNFLQLVRSDLPGTAPYQSRERQSTADIDAPSFERSRSRGHALTLSWSPSNWLTIKSITGQRTVRWADSLDLDGTPDATAHSQRFTDYRQFSQDLNLSGAVGLGKFSGGLYYFRDDGFTNNPINFYQQTINFDSRYGTESRAWAAYGQFDWAVSEPLTVTLGLRYTDEEKVLERVTGFRPNQNLPFVYFVSEGFRTPPATFTATTPLLALAWKFNARLNAYARYAEGFKSGGYNGEYSNLQDVPDDGIPGTTNDNQEQTLIPFRPERQRSLEIGVKARAWDGRLSANLAIFQNKLEDLQASIFTGGGAAATVVRNAGQATVRGLEIETTLVPLPDTRLTLNLALLDPEYDVFEDEDANGNFGNQADNRAFVHAPRRSWNVVFDSRLFRLGSGVLRGIVDYVWTDALFTYPYQLSGPGEPGYDSNRQVARNSRVAAHGLLNARLQWEPAGSDKRWQLELALWGRNLLDEATPNNFIDFGPGLFQNLTVANFVEPRAAGLSIGLNW